MFKLSLPAKKMRPIWQRAVELTWYYCFDNMVETHYVRDERRFSYERWLIGFDWVRHRVRVRYDPKSLSTSFSNEW